MYTSKYDIVIVGGGIAGIYTMYNLKKKYPDLKVLLLEKNDRIGGRVYTYNKSIDGVNYTMDLGAGRIGYHHKLMVELINNLGLSKYIHSIKNAENYIEYDNKKKLGVNKSSLKTYLSKLLYKFFNSTKLKKIKPTVLKKYYLRELLQRFFNKSQYRSIEETFEYKNKLHHFNSYDAIKYFRDDYNSKSKFFIMLNGMTSIINAMVEYINNNNNYLIKKNAYVKDIIYNTDTSNYIIKYNLNSDLINIESKYVVCCMPRHELIKFKLLTRYKKQLNTINEISKVRIFEVYNVKDINNVWFHNISKTVTNNELQFVIPINKTNGLIMSSYNENISYNSNYWNELYKKGINILKNKLRDKLSNTFNVNVPESKYIKFYYWKYGVACWKKNVDSEFVSQQIINLLPNFYICGENYSTYQAWCEGALLTSSYVLKKLYCDLDKKILDSKLIKKTQFLFNPNNPKKSFDVYIDKNPNDTINIKYSTIDDINSTIKKLEHLYKTKKYTHKRIWQVGMIMKVRMQAMLKHKKTRYKKAKNVLSRYNLTKKYYNFLKKRTSAKTFKERKKMIFK